jgi:DNA-binding CsgD family transcriptional regulator
VTAPDEKRDLLQALRYIGEAQDIVDFAVRTCQELLRLVPGVSSSYNEVNIAAQRVAGLVHPDPGREWFEHYIEIFEANLGDNPLVIHFATSGESEPATWTDLDPEGKFFNTTLYREFYAPNDIHSQLGFLLPAPPGIFVALVINRDGTEFDARERTLLSELRLHLVNLYRLVSHAEAGRQREAALADDGWSVILVDDAGTVLQSNPVAVSIGAAAGVDLSVGARLADGPMWTAMSGPRADRWTSSRVAPTKVPGGAQVPFEVRLLRSPVGPHVLWIREPNRVSSDDAVALGLTARQAQVAILLVDGLTNEQIARRLGISTGTVRKHLEAVFDRLAVPSRAAAVGRLQAGSGARASADLSLA